MDATVFGLRSSPSGLIVLGNFTNAGPTPANRIALWDGSQWQAYDGGLDGHADDAAVTGSSIYVGGQFRNANGQTSHYVAHWIQSPTGIGDVTPRAQATLLAPPYPNPFNPATTIEYNLASAGAVSVAVYDVSGRLVRALVDDPNAAAGPHATVWHGDDTRGNVVASGVYYVRMQTGGASQTQKVVLLK